MIYKLLLLFLLPLFSLFGKETVLVSILPYKSMVERLGGDLVDVAVMLPVSADEHTYEPTPKQMLQFSKSALWFYLGETFEKRALPSLKNYNPNIKIIDLSNGIDLICGVGCCAAHEACDLHYWLSPRIVEKQVVAIAEGLISLYPEKKEEITKRLVALQSDLAALDQSIEKTLAPLQDRTFFVSHPSYGYFARDYHLQQIPVEFEGKEPSPRQLTALLQIAREHNAKTIFIQNEFSSKGARLVAADLGAKVVSLHPLSENYFAAMNEIAKEIASK